MRRTQSAATVKMITVRSSTTLVILGLLPLYCLSFHVIIQPPGHHITKSSSSRICSTKSSSSNADTTAYFNPYNNLEEYNNEPSSSSSLPISNNGVEIWLDLRGTSLSPSTALELWDLEHPHDNNDDDDDFVYNKSNVPFTKCLVSPSSSDINKNSQNEKQLLLQQHNNIHVVVDNEASSSWGKILSLETSTRSSSSIPILPDPLPAMEIISQGRWIILDTTLGWKKVEEETRLSYLLPLAELISSGAVTGVGGGGGGGIGFTCQTKNEVVKVAMWIQSITNRCNDGGGGGKNVRVKTLENGLVIPDSDAVTMDDLQQQQLFGTTRQARLQYAIVVPYDVGLLKTAAMLLLNEGF